MKKFLKIFLVVIIVLVASFFAYFYIGTYKADAEALKYLESTDIVKITKKDNYYLFDGPGNEEALVFYPGAKVEYTSYAKFVYKIAENGLDVFLLKMPCNFAFFDANAAARVIDGVNYDKYYVGGHSLGGVVASNYAINNPDKVKIVINFASYIVNELPDTIEYISFYGSEDEVVNKKVYEESKANWPKESKEFIIDGANHASFSNYGEQKGDGKALISNDKVQDYVVERLVEEVINLQENL